MAQMMHRETSRPGRAEGFTLIELVTVMAIVAILSAIAIPQYFQYIARGHRSEARATLTQAAQWMERWRTERNSYQDPANAPNPPALPAALQNSPASGNPMYNITVATPAPGQYTLSATPINPGPMANDACGTLTLDSTGLRGVTGPLDINTCWGR
ncbi:MAG TPA: type IV pilin protein [Burkholderiaceae bacterium]|nr:type IV pilin protein [Burkholderiaceae bacterium]